ncbi:Nucleoside-diphosphate-sugar epimerase [Klenkia marina]|uniref:Nucleoside-diphosphate-sugar epimerase n=1 Tax=Klenkia marina TaxID=1960309 RepID=A0A1G4X930_9ACTN|nr:epimerase [Klenkia marina]SCX37682.1 Nucleoside-diphosphate-sugar epimerase [Klenkia marina]
MRVLVLGGTHFLGRHVVDAALAAGHDVATLTRGVSGDPPDGVRAFRGDREQPLPGDVLAWAPELVVDTSCRTRAAGEHAAVLDPAGYAFVSSLNAYRDWPPGPVRSEHDPTWDTDDDEYGPAKAHAERVLGAALGDRLLTARAGLVVGPHDRVHRLGWWLLRIAAGGPVVVPDALAQPMALVDARDLAGWLVAACGQVSGPVNATGPAGMTTLGGLLDTCREVTGGDAEWVVVPEDDLLAAGVQPWVHLPLWLPADTARTAWDVDTTRARELGLPSRPLRDTVADTWAWLQAAGAPGGDDLPGLPPDLEARLLALPRT